MGVTDQPTTVNVPHDVLYAKKSQVYVRGVVHGQQDAR